MILFKPRVGKVIFAQTTSGFSIITPEHNIEAVRIIESHIRNDREYESWVGHWVEV